MASGLLFEMDSPVVPSKIAEPREVSIAKCTSDFIWTHLKGATSKFNVREEENQTWAYKLPVHDFPLFALWRGLGYEHAIEWPTKMYSQWA